MSSSTTQHVHIGASDRAPRPSAPPITRLAHAYKRARVLPARTIDRAPCHMVPSIARFARWRHRLSALSINWHHRSRDLPRDAKQRATSAAAPSDAGLAQRRHRPRALPVGATACA
jgi:hypothetical protein